MQCCIYHSSTTHTGIREMFRKDKKTTRQKEFGAERERGINGVVLQSAKKFKDQFFPQK